MTVAGREISGAQAQFLTRKASPLSTTLGELEQRAINEREEADDFRAAGGDQRAYMRLRLGRGVVRRGNAFIMGGGGL
ncbi:MAG: hypothetical protein KF773_24235 [Deltaproteobacteria bacterium]|nr:hypothetical protein [Deltaproteobacteria bacterium]